MKPASGLPRSATRALFSSIIQRYWLTALIVAIIIGVLGVFAWETGWGRYLSPNIPKFDGAPRKADNIAILPPFTMPPIDPTYKETVERPLFSQTRRPNPPATAVAVAPIMEKGRYRLSGTSVGPELSTAFLVDLKSGKTWRAIKGSVVDPTGSQGVKLDSVAATQVVLKLGEETEVLSLATSKSAAVPPPIPGAPQNAIPGVAPTVSGAPAQVMPTLSAGPTATNSFGAGGAFGRPQTDVPMPPSPVPGQTGNVPLPAAAGANSGPVPMPSNAGGIPVPGSANNTTTTNLPEPTAARRRRFQNLPQ
jgi:hypothetical protein